MLHLILSQEEIKVNGKEDLRFFLKEEHHLVPMTMATAPSANEYVKQFNENDYCIVELNDSVVKRLAHPEAQLLVDELVANGYHAHGKVYRPIFINASQARQAQFTTIADSARKGFEEWAYLGFDKHKFDPLSPNKRAKYLGLDFSSVKHWNSIWGNDPVLQAALPQPKFSECCCLKDVEVEVPGIFDIVLQDEIRREFKPHHLNKITDGVIFIKIDDHDLTKEERTELANKLKTFSIRAPFIKGYVCIIFHTALEELIRKERLNPNVRDYWTDPVNLLEKRVIMFGSAFKAAKCFKSWNEYAEAAEKYGHQFFICVEDHGRKKNGIPYQQLQTLPLTDEDVIGLVDRTAGKLLDAVQSVSFKGFMRTNLGKAITEYPSLLQNNVVWRLAQQTYANQRRRMLGGRLPRAAHNLFCAIDPIAIFEAIMGTPAKGILKAKQCTTRVFKYGRMLDCTRSPHLDHAHALRENVAVPVWARGFFLGNGIFYSAHDNTMVLHQMDFDGDHSNVTDWSILIEAAKRGYKQYNNVPLYYEANDAHGEADSSDYENQLNEMCRVAASAPIGIYVNALTKYWAIGYSPLEVALLTRAGNGTIDSFGHGANANSNATEDAVHKVFKRGLPWFLSYAHGHVSEQDPTKIERAIGDDNKYERYRNSGVEKYSVMCLMTLPADIGTIVDANKFEAYNSRILQCDPTRVVGGKAAPDLVHKDTGLFNKLSSATMADMNNICKNGSMKAFPGYEEMRREYIRTELQQYAIEHGLTEEDVIDALILNIMYKTKRDDSFAPTLVRMLFLVYGDRILENIQANLNHTVTEASSEDLDDELGCDENDDQYEEY